MSGGGGQSPCKVRSKLNKFEHVGRGDRAPCAEEEGLKTMALYGREVGTPLNRQTDRHD